MSDRTLLEAALDASSEGVLILSVKNGIAGAVEYVNRAFEEISGYDSEELLGKDIEFLRRLTIDKDVGDKIRQAIASRSSVNLQLNLRAKDSAVFQGCMSISPVFDRRARLSHLIFVCHDISELMNYKFAVESRNRELANANDLLQELVVHDPMTNLYNRRFFDTELDRMIAFHQRRGLLINLAFFDVDYFKRYNDRYGHFAGDGALKSVAQEIKRNFSRAGDIVARYGGEEFVVLSSADADTDAFMQHVEDVRKGVEALGLPHLDSKVAKVITVSAGVNSSVPSKRCSSRSVVNAADHAMYLAKQQGRNRIAITPSLKLAEAQ